MAGRPPSDPEANRQIMEEANLLIERTKTLMGWTTSDYARHLKVSKQCLHMWQSKLRTPTPYLLGEIRRVHELAKLNCRMRASEYLGRPTEAEARR
jgi:hypothetical protein